MVPSTSTVSPLDPRWKVALLGGNPLILGMAEVTLPCPFSARTKEIRIRTVEALPVRLGLCRCILSIPQESIWPANPRPPKHRLLGPRMMFPNPNRQRINHCDALGRGAIPSPRTNPNTGMPLVVCPKGAHTDFRAPLENTLFVTKSPTDVKSRIVRGWKALVQRTILRDIERASTNLSQQPVLIEAFAAQHLPVLKRKKSGRALIISVNTANACIPKRTSKYWSRSQWYPRIIMDTCSIDERAGPSWSRDARQDPMPVKLTTLVGNLDHRTKTRIAPSQSRCATRICRRCRSCQVFRLSKMARFRSLRLLKVQTLEPQMIPWVLESG